MIVEANRHLLEGISILTCVIAASVGPMLLIGAHFTMSFPIAGLIFAFLSVFIYRLLNVVERRIILYKLSEKGKAVLGIVFGLIPFLSILFFMFSGDFRSMLSFRLGEGLANIPILISLSLLLFVIFLISSKKLYSAIYEVGYYFFLPITILLLILPGIPSSEGKVLLINIGVVYFISYTVLTRVRSGFNV